MDDVFDEDADELTTVSQKEFNKIIGHIEKEAFVEGAEKGKDEAVQDGFNKGYEIAFKFFYKINLLRGVVSASMNVKKEKLDQLKSINESLINLEKKMRDELIKEPHKDHTEQFNEAFETIKNQSKELNLFNDLDPFLMMD